jgi:hypothetical protein
VNFLDPQNLEFGWHVTEASNEASIDAEGLRAPASISIGYPTFAGMLFDMLKGEKLIVYRVELFGLTLHPDDDGPPAFRLREPVPPIALKKVAYMIGEEIYEPIG